MSKTYDEYAKNKLALDKFFDAQDAKERAARDAAYI
jgi:hypothetical protein